MRCLKGVPHVVASLPNLGHCLMGAMEVGDESHEWLPIRLNVLPSGRLQGFITRADLLHKFKDWLFRTHAVGELNDHLDCGVYW